MEINSTQGVQSSDALPERHLARLRSDIQAYIQTLAFAEPPFNLDIRWSMTYNELFRDEGEITNESAIIARAFNAGRVLLVGRGGAGKSRMMLRILRAAAGIGIIVVHVRLQDWLADDDDEWEATTRSNLANGGGFLIDRFGKPATSAVILDWLPPDTRKLLLVDGLNELPSMRGLQILKALDELTRNQVSMAAVVTDRLARRDLPRPVRWDLGLVQPLSSGQIQAAVTSSGLEPGLSMQLLSSPYFLDRALKRDGIASGVVRTQEDYFAGHVNLTAPELETAASASYDAYRTSRGRSFSLERFREIAGSVSTTKLLDAGALVIASDRTAHFLHHLLHDFLASRYVASLGPTEWTSDVFDAITLQASSFDSVAMVFEQLSGRTADRLLECLYDWNLYAAGYALAEAINGLVAPSQEMQVLIYAMLAEKQFDPILASRQRATDSLLVVKSTIASAMADASNFDRVCEVVNEVASTSDWFQSWRSLFTDVSVRDISDLDLERLFSGDSVMGWTMANVARRLDMTVRVRRELVSKLLDAEVPVRWRIAHVLGAFPTNSNSRVLLKLLDADESHLVRYGSLRSLVEMAARTGDPRLRSSVIRAIRQRIPTIDQIPRLKEELSRALVVDPLLAPPEWRKVVLSVAREFYLRTEDTAARDQWRAFAAESAARYSKDLSDTTTLRIEPELASFNSTRVQSGGARNSALRVRALRHLYNAILYGTDEMEAVLASVTRFDWARMPSLLASWLLTGRAESGSRRARLLKDVDSRLQAENRALLLRSR